jgi:hypothetical protein
MPIRTDITALVESFVGQLSTLVQQKTEIRAREAVLAAFNAPAPEIRRRADPRRRLQGRYIGLLRHFSGKDREKVRALYSSKGVEAAIAYMARITARAN